VIALAFKCRPTPVFDYRLCAGFEGSAGIVGWFCGEVIGNF
jgi:hypothetical protein